MAIFKLCLRPKVLDCGLSETRFHQTTSICETIITFLAGERDWIKQTLKLLMMM